MTAYARIFSDLYGDVITKAHLDASADLTRTKEWLNQALSDAAVRSKYFTGSSAGTALAAAATSQALPSAIIEVDAISCTYAGLAPTLAEVSFQELLQARGGGSVSGPPRLYALRQATVEFWPAAAGSEVLTYYGAVYPDELSGASDTIPLPEPFGNVLTYGALVQAGEFKKDPVLPTWVQQQQYWLTRFLAFSARRGGAGPYRVGVRGAGGGFVFPNPSTDVPWQS